MLRWRNSDSSNEPEVAGDRPLETGIRFPHTTHPYGLAGPEPTGRSSTIKFVDYDASNSNAQQDPKTAKQNAIKSALKKAGASKSTQDAATAAHEATDCDGLTAAEDEGNGKMVIYIVLPIGNDDEALFWHEYYHAYLYSFFWQNDALDAFNECADDYDLVDNGVSPPTTITVTTPSSGKGNGKKYKVTIPRDKEGDGSVHGREPTITEITPSSSDKRSGCIGGSEGDGGESRLACSVDSGSDSGYNVCHTAGPIAMDKGVYSNVHGDLVVNLRPSKDKFCSFWTGTAVAQLKEPSR